MPTRRPNAATLSIAFALALAAAGSAAATRARGQTPQPNVPEVRERNGIVQRMIPIQPHLPPDPRRDQWADTRWIDPPNLRFHPNWYQNGGMYGLAWKADHTASYAPYFFGSPGKSTMHGDENRARGLTYAVRSAFHPFKPVGMYYEQGSYVPVYDTRPFVPGPTGWPYPFYRRLTNWGG